MDQSNHDTIGIIAMNSKGQTAVAVSTNGLGHKIHGRVGDSPIVGAGAFARDGVGAAVQTGDGDVMLRFLPTFKGCFQSDVYNATQNYYYDWIY